jgi:hypothetical protein
MRRILSYRTGAALLLAAALLPTALPVRAAEGFNPHFILTDAEMRDAGAMDYGDILLFLASKGRLAEVSDVDPVDGQAKDAARLIHDAAQRHAISPKYLLTLLQKESSAVEATELTKRQLDWAAGYGICDSCAKDDPAVQKYRGLARQIDYGASWMDWYLSGEAGGYLQAGETASIDSEAVRPVNLATAALYTYTPHVHGNRLLWSIWNRWFGPGAASFNYPDGTLLRNARTGGVALMQQGALRPILSPAVLRTRFGGAPIVDLNDYDFETLIQARRGQPVRFANYSLVETETGDLYLLVDDAARRIVSPEVFAGLGFNPEEILSASAAEIAAYEPGADITAASAPPTGQLVRDAAGRVWYVEGDARRRVLDPGVLRANFALRPIRTTAELGIDLETLADAGPVPLRDGSLVKAESHPRVYVIENGGRRPIADEASFLAFGFRWTNIITVSQATLDLHEDGEPLMFAGLGHQ